MHQHLSPLTADEQLLRKTTELDGIVGSDEVCVYVCGGIALNKDRCDNNEKHK